MDEVETAAADTTSDHSSPYHYHHHHQSSSQNFLPSVPSLSNYHHQPQQQHYMYNEASEEPCSKRLRTAEPQELTFSTTDKQNRQFGGLLDEQPPPGHHDPGSTAIVRLQKPIGIAQPFRMQEQSQSKIVQGSGIVEDSKQKSTWMSNNDPHVESDRLPSFPKSVTSSPEEEEQYDSDKSGKRFSKFTNESKTEQVDQKAVQLGEVETESDSESVSNFEFPFAPPSSESVEDESNNESETVVTERALELKYKKDATGNVTQLSREWQPADEHVCAKASLKSHHDTLELPHGKMYHVFVSHSTSDEKWVRDSVLHPLSNKHGMTGAACFNFMHNSQYNDSEIKKAMKESCVVLIGISPAYLKSGRCEQEWQLAIQLSCEKRCQVVVAAVAVCSRPEPIKRFLYLDFMERSKLKSVWEVLIKTINDAVLSMKPKLCPENPHASQNQQVYESTSKIQKRFKETNQPKTKEHSPPHFQLHQQQDNSSDLGNTSQDDFFDYQRRLTAGFDEMCQEMCQDEDIIQPEGVYPGPWGISTEDVGPSTDQHTSISDPRNLKDETNVSDGLEKGKNDKEDIEEGEVSDSSGEVSGTIEDDQTHAQSALVANFYDKLAEPDADKRNESPIFYMRNFNNWVKSILIRTHLSQLSHGSTVLDLCCGKGGDLLKWKEGGIGYLVCADISEASIEACEARLHSPKMINRSTGKLPFEAEFIVADCCEVRLRDRYKNPARRFNLASCQFSVHYSFESYEKAHMMLRNACENLRHGGFFIGTTIDSNQLVNRLRQAGQREDGTWSIGNDIFSVTLDPSLDPYNLPLFGARYNFKLHGVVDLPEFLVHFPLLVSMLKDFDMELKLQQNFYDFFTERRYNTDDVYLMSRMKAFNLQTGTMSIAEWEAVGLYLVYVFQKK